MNNRTLIFIGLIFLHISLYAQDYVISGVVRNARTKETIISAKISVLSLSIGTVTNKDGYYSLKIPQGTHTIKLTAYGYQPKEETITIQDNLIHNFELSELVYQKDEIIVTDKKLDENVKSSSMGKVTLSLEQLKKMATAFSEVDIIRSFLTTPGVSTANDFIQGFNVRGGSVDQNLVLLDDMVLFNPYHFLGLFSSFNPDALKTATLYKTNIPVELGGRATSVLDITQKNGNGKEYSATAYISLVDAKILIEGPLTPTKGSFMVAARRSYFDLYLQAIQSSFPKLFSGAISSSITNLYFYDINAKISYPFDDFNDVSLSFYTGRDVVSLQQDVFGNGSYLNTIDKHYGNIAGSLNWRHIFSEGFVSNFIVAITNYSIDSRNSNFSKIYDYSTRTYSDTTKQSYSLLQEIINIGLKQKFTYYANNDLLLKFGIEGTGFFLIPGVTTITNKAVKKSEITTQLRFQNRAYTECVAYFGIEQKITNYIQLDYGVRGSIYLTLGPLTVNEYQNNQPIVYDPSTGFPFYGIKTGQKSYGNFEVTNYQLGIEPRISARFLIDDETSIKTGYSWLRQNLQMTTIFSLLDFPIDTWYVSDKYIQPQTSHNFTLGVYRNFFDNEIEISLEGYFRLMQNLNDYIEGFNPFTRPSNIEEQFLYQADGRAYGVELYIIKNRGKRNHWTDNFFGTISYTFSRTERKYPDQLRDALPISIPEYYSLGYDKTHNFNITVSYKIDDWTLGVSFTYQTNIPKLISQARYMGNDFSFSNYYGYTFNNYRLSDYHRLDISARKDIKINIPEIHRTFDISIILTIFNVYNRINAISGSFLLQNNNNNNGNYVYQESGFIPIIPSVGVEFKL